MVASSSLETIFCILPLGNRLSSHKNEKFPKKEKWENIPLPFFYVNRFPGSFN
jgi:hypothetical protein